MQRERSLFDDRYGYPGSFQMLLCKACGHRRLETQMDAQQITELYTRFYPRSCFDLDSWSPPRETTRFYSWWHGSRASAFRWVPPNVRVLDVGCGLGEALGFHRARGCEAHGVEVDRNVARVAERHGLDIKLGLFDAANYEPASFDVVTLDQVIEHMPTPQAVLQGVHRVLKTNGMLVLSTPNADGWGARVFGRRWIHWHAPYHLQFFSARSISRTAAQAGFRLERRMTVTNAAWLDYQWHHLAAYPAAGKPSPFWASLPRSLRQRISFRLCRGVERLRVNILLTRLMDALGCGDNVVYVFRKAAA
jgi:2-polyprenyl-3-methyl-5-hydroxy-6-metoxy-1,4-benzoquinol methylase